MGRTISFTLVYLEIRKYFLKYHTPPHPSASKSFCLYMCYNILYLTHCMEVACWHKMGGDVQQPKNPGPKPIKCIFYRIRNERQ